MNLPIEFNYKEFHSDSNVVIKFFRLFIGSQNYTT